MSEWVASGRESDVGFPLRVPETGQSPFGQKRPCLGNTPCRLEACLAVAPGSRHRAWSLNAVTLAFLPARLDGTPTSSPFGPTLSRDAARGFGRRVRFACAGYRAEAKVRLAAERWLRPHLLP